MTVDKAFEELNQTGDEYWCSSDFANNYDCAPGEYHRALGFHQGFTAGQKTLSPEVQEAAGELLDWFCKRTFTCTKCNLVGCKGLKLGKLLEAKE